MNTNTISRVLIAGITFTLVFQGCASLTTVKEKTTRTTRNLRIEKTVDIKFEPVRQPDVESPNLVVAVTQTTNKVQHLERRSIQRRTMKPVIRALIWLGGIGIAGGGYYLYDQTGWLVVGRDLMGLGGLLPLSAEILAGKVILEQWKPETRKIPPLTVPLRDTEINITVGTDSLLISTDRKGRLNLNISDYSHLVPPGNVMLLSMTFQSNPDWEASLSIASEVVAAHRPPAQPTEPAPTITSIASLVNIAVLDFEGVGVSAQEARVLTTRLGTHLVQSGYYRVIERDQMRQILDEQDFQMTGCTNNECAVEIGQLIGAEQILSGTFGKIGSMFTIDMRIIDVETGSILRSTSYDISGTIDNVLTRGLTEAIRRLVEGR